MSVEDGQVRALPDGFVIEPAISLRDWFAGQAMATLAATLTEDIHHEASGDYQPTTVRVILDEEWIDDFSLGQIARASYDLADAMLRARTPTPERTDG